MGEKNERRSIGRYLPQIGKFPILNERRIRRMAALKYSGTWSQGRYEEKKEQLMEWIAGRGLKQIGEPIFARYHPPFMPWFLRRNEVLIPVDRPQS
jgi:hypothetical protein